MTEEPLTDSMHLRMTAEDKRRLDELVQNMGIFKKSALARIALRLGMEALEEDPALAVGGAKKSDPE